MSKDMDVEYGNSKPVEWRTKISLKILMLMIRILMPYKYEHQFDKQLKEISDMVDKVDS